MNEMKYKNEENRHSDARREKLIEAKKVVRCVKVIWSLSLYEKHLFTEFFTQTRATRVIYEIFRIKRENIN